MKCLNFNVRILKAKNWNLKFVCEMFEIWNFENKNVWNVWILKVEDWKLNLKSLCEAFGIWKFEN
jgi:hypothetical protein